MGLSPYLFFFLGGGVGLSPGSLLRLHIWNGYWLSFWYGEYVFPSCCGL